MYWRNNKKELEDLDVTIDPDRKYTNTELNLICDAMLRQDVKVEMCRECKGRGEETGIIRDEIQKEKNEEGENLVVQFKEFECPEGHIWFTGEGVARGIGGENPILFEEHIHSRRRREIYTTVGTPDPSIVQGIYNRSHPQGRKINSEDQRKRHGASYYR